MTRVLICGRCWRPIQTADLVGPVCPYCHRETRWRSLDALGTPDYVLTEHDRRFLAGLCIASS